MLYHVDFTSNARYYTNARYFLLYDFARYDTNARYFPLYDFAYVRFYTNARFYYKLFIVTDSPTHDSTHDVLCLLLSNNKEERKIMEC